VLTIEFENIVKKNNKATNNSNIS